MMSLIDASMLASSNRWLDALPGPAWLLMDLPGQGLRLQDLNQAAAQMLGRPAELWRGQPWQACLDCLPAEIREAARGADIGRGLACGAWWLRLAPVPEESPSESTRLSLFSMWPQSPPEHQPVALAAQASAAARADQDSFSYTVSHDLRAPLRVVEGFARILKEDYGRQLDGMGNDAVDRIMSATARMNSMIDALLSLTQLSSKTMVREPVDLSLLARLVMDDLQCIDPARQLELTIQPELMTVGDPTLLRMVLENLLGNAWKYSAKGELSQIAFFAEQQTGRGLVYVVRDNGAGFDMRGAERLFSVFQRLHSASEFPGTGVGLASVRRIVHRHGGEIWARSEPGRGASFFFTLAP
ncbi:MAG: hypothetical protein JOY60_17170 [Burkholderiaceae bacterium]|nr:hypothetical protein [Burkholderiaceae bacterium]